MYADGKKCAGWGLLDIRHLENPRYVSQGSMKLRLEDDSRDGKLHYPSILLQDEIINPDDLSRSTALCVSGIPPTALEGEVLPIIRTAMQDIINSAELGKLSSAKKALKAFTIRRIRNEEGTRVYAVKTANNDVRDELRKVLWTVPHHGPRSPSLPEALRSKARSIWRRQKPMHVTHCTFMTRQGKGNTETCAR